MTLYSNLTLSIDGVPHPGVEVTVERAPRAPSIAETIASLNESMATLLSLRPTRGQVRRARRRRRGRERADRIRVVRDLAQWTRCPTFSWFGLCPDHDRSRMMFGRRARGVRS
jgi:hypothetical protein